MIVAPSDMILFAAVVRTGGFTRAARLLGITKQSASDRVARLEQGLGVRLLERTTRAMRLTEPGATYYERCAAIASQIDEANAEVLQRQATPTGQLRVSAPVLYGRRFLAPVVADYMARYPDVRVDLVLADRRVDLIDEGIDVAVRIGALDDSSLSARKLGDGHVYVVASPGWLATHGSPTPANLATQRCVGVRTREVWHVAGVRARVEPVLVVNDLEVACVAVQAGIGLALLPGLVCREAVRDGRLRVLFGPEPAAVPGVWAVFPSRRHLSARVRAFLDVLSAMVEPMQPLPVGKRRGR